MPGLPSMGPMAQGVVEDGQGAETDIRRLPTLRPQGNDRVQIARGIGTRIGHFFARVAPERGTIFGI